jgi:hypothetical protein
MLQLTSSSITYIYLYYLNCNYKTNCDYVQSSERKRKCTHIYFLGFCFHGFILHFCRC